MTADDSGPDRLDVALGLALRLRRHGHGLSQTQLAERIGVSFQQVQKYERGANRVSFSTLVRICETLDCSVPELVAEVERLGGARAEVALLVQDEAPALLEALAGIRSPAVREALVTFTRALAKAR